MIQEEQSSEEAYIVGVDEAATILGCSRPRLSQLTASGTFSFQKRRVGDRNRTFYRRSELLEYMTRRSQVTVRSLAGASCSQPQRFVSPDDFAMLNHLETNVTEPLHTKERNHSQFALSQSSRKPSANTSTARTSASMIAKESMQTETLQRLECQVKELTLALQESQAYSKLIFNRVLLKLEQMERGINHFEHTPRPDSSSTKCACRDQTLNEVNSLPIRKKPRKIPHKKRSRLLYLLVQTISSKKTKRRPYRQGKKRNRTFNFHR